MPLDKTKLGTRYTCFSCGTKFYDLNRPLPTCPECDADQNEAPVQDLKALLSRSRRSMPVPPVAEPEKVEDTESTDDDDDGLFDKADEEDDSDEDGD